MSITIAEKVCGTVGAGGSLSHKCCHSNMPGDPAAATAAMLVSGAEAAALCGIARSTWLKLHAQGKTPLPVKLGRRTLWARTGLAAWIAAGCPSRDRWQKIGQGA